MHKTVDIDLDEIEILFKEHYQDLTRYAYSITKEQTSAEDVVQQLFVKLWEKRNDLSIQTDPKSYLFRATYNASINVWKKRQRMDRDGEVSSSTFASEQTSDRVLSKELEERIENAIQTLPEKCQEVFRLSRFNELSYKEIAEELDISSKTVENHMGKALKLMRQELSDYLPQIVITLLLSMKW